MKNRFRLFSFIVLLGVILLNLSSCDDTNSHAQSQTVGVPQTGQTMCWDEEGVEIDCADTGHDGDIQAGVVIPEPRFVDNGDGTITDNLTNLVWLQDWFCPDINPGGSNTDYSRWQEAVDLTHQILQDGICGLTDGSNVKDWRVPNIKELLSVVDYQLFDPTIITFFFHNVKSDLYWSSTTNEEIPRTAWQVNFRDGKDTFSSKTFFAGFVTAVRN